MFVLLNKKKKKKKITKSVDHIKTKAVHHV